MEQEAKHQLLVRLDECLLEHAAALNGKDGPTIKGVYNLQGLSEIHYYLKVEHEFNPAEVEALLRFADPLEVAMCCWEDNPHEHSFPICELLKETRAYERFPMADVSRPEKASIRERLHDAMKEARRQPAPEGRPRSDEPR